MTYLIRNIKGTALQVLLPLSLIVIVSIVSNTIDVDTFQETSYKPQGITTSANPEDFPKGFELQHLMKNCKNRQTGGYASFAPRNEITEQLAELSKLNKNEVIFFDSGKEFNEYIDSDDYGIRYKNGTSKRLCFGVIFNEYDEQNLNYSYDLRFNVSLPQYSDHYLTQFHSFKIPFKVNDSIDYQKNFNSGISTFQTVIDSLIIKKHSDIRNQSVQFQQMKSPDYQERKFFLLEGAVGFIFILSGLITFLRMIGFMVSEKEGRNIENLSNMGVSKATFYLASLTAQAVVHFVLAILVAVGLKLFMLQHSNMIMIFLLYFLFALILDCMAFFISTFFFSTKRAIIFGIVFYIILEIPYVMRDKFKTIGPDAMLKSTISPIAGLGQILNSIMLAESSFMGYSLWQFTQLINYYRGINFVYYFIIEYTIFLLLGLYFFYVIPHEIGVAQHPLFFLGFPKKKIEKKIKGKIDFKNNENFEDISQDLLDQIDQNRAISIRNLSKVYSNKTKAVDDLSIDLFQNQIFAMLGHNGAGKTTTISMLSGMIKKTSGSIDIMGYTHERNPNDIKKLMGICTQYNIIFDYLTVEEHLKLYANVKGVYKNIDSEIDEVLNDIDLLHKKKQFAKNLSGGQKRKLSVAIAFIGGSKIILLDEPTSGMDAYARRLLWDMIKKYKSNRLILLTTHNMDEADYLGDRIAIMSKGKILTCGSSMFLKKRFGTGYELTIVKQPQCKEQELTQKIKAITPNTDFIFNFGSELKYKLHYDDLNKFDELFAEIENLQESKNSGIENFGITLTTLEKVFLKVASEGVVKKSENQQEVVEQIKTKQALSEGTRNETLHKLRHKSNSKIFWMQFKALVKKRFIYFSRDFSSLSCEIIIPIVLLLLGIFLTTFQFITNPDSIGLTNSLYPNQFKINDFVNKGVNYTDIIASKIPNNPDVEVVDINNLEQFDAELYKYNSTDQNQAYYLNDIDANSYSYNIFVNSTAPFTSFISANTLNNALLKHYSNNDNAQIKATLHPLPQTKLFFKYENTVDGFIIHSFINLGFMFIAASMIVIIIKEREKNSKHQQIISGAGLPVFWISNFVVDYIKFLIPSFVMLLILYICKVDIFTSGDKTLMLICLFLVYGLNCVFMIYIFSFLFRSVGKGQVFIFIFTYFTQLFLSSLIFALKIIPKTSDFTMDYLEYIMRIIPPFTFSYAIQALPNLEVFALYFRWEEVPKAFEKRGCLWELIYLCVSALILGIILFCMEFSHKLYFLIAKRKQKKTRSLNNSELSEDLIMSQNEDEEINTNADIKVMNLVKNYKIPGGIKKAIKGINFELEQGNILGLLGTNGAGKTTTFKILTGDIFPTSGRVFIKQQEMPDKFLQIRQFLGYCPQFDPLLDNLTAREHLYLFASLKGVEEKHHQRIVEEMLMRMNLQQYADIQSKNYSGGNKRKLSVAIALLGSPAIILLDEPSAGMDPESRRFMWNVINQLSVESKNSSILLTTHSMEEAESLATQISILVEGEIKTRGTVQQLKNAFGNKFELDIKLKNPNKEYYTEYNLQFKELKDKHTLNIDDCRYILNKIDKLELYDIIKKEQNQDDKQYNIGFEDFIEWIYCQQNYKKIDKEIEQDIDGIRIETYRTYASYQIPMQQKLSKIFRIMEDKSDKYNIINYSLKQISLEQIFMNFANQAIHDEDVDNQFQIDGIFNKYKLIFNNNQKMNERGEKRESLWFQMLESILSKKIDQSGNVLLLGSSKTGKKKIIEQMKNLIDDNQNNIEEMNEYKDLEKVYIMDFKYIKLKKQNQDHHENKGKLNFYIINKQYEFMSQFFSKEMMKNLIIIICIDISKPEEFENELFEWINFTRNSIYQFLDEIEPLRRQQILDNFENSIQNLQQLNVGDKEQQDTVQEDMNEIKEENESEEDKQLSDTEMMQQRNSITENQTLQQLQELTSRAQSKWENINKNDIKLPLLLLGMKTDILTTINDVKLLDFINYKIRKLSLEYNCTLLTLSSYQQKNIDKLLQLLLYTLIENKQFDKDKLKASFNLQQLFIPLNTDTLDNLNDKFSNVLDYKFEQKAIQQQQDNNTQKQNIKYIQDFFGDIKNNVFNYQNNKEQTYSTRKIPFESSKNIKYVQGTDRTNKIRDILNRNNIVQQLFFIYIILICFFVQTFLKIYQYNL